MSGIFLLDLADLARAARETARHYGLDLPPVVELKGWQTRSNGHGGFASVMGICEHHTASGRAVETMSAAYYATLQPNNPNKPEYNVMIGRDGQMVVLAAGGVNGQGKGGPWTTSKGTIAKDRSNNRLIAICCNLDGVGEVAPKAQVVAQRCLTDVLAKAHGLQVGDIISHKEWVHPSCAGRKIDPFGSWEPGRNGTAGNWGPKAPQRPNIDTFRGFVWTGIYPGDEGAPPVTTAPTPALRADGTDVSFWQGLADWDKAWAWNGWSGVSQGHAGPWWVAMRVWDRQHGTDGKPGSGPDVTFGHNRQGTKRANWRLFYHYLEGDRSIEEQIKQYFDTVNANGGPLGKGEGVMLDAEADCTEPQTFEALFRIEAVTRRPTAVYTNHRVDGGAIWRSERIRTSGFGPRPMIFPNYSGVLSTAASFAQPFKWDALQWTNRAVVPGLGQVDLDMVEDFGIKFNAVCGLP
jgi:hypothetical protein